MVECLGLGEGGGGGVGGGYGLGTKLSNPNHYAYDSKKPTGSLVKLEKPRTGDLTSQIQLKY
jgi:hypothetical protein